MYAAIKNNTLISITDYKPTEKNFLFDKLIQWDFDTNKSRIFKDWEIKENLIIERVLTIEEQIAQIKAKYQNTIYSKYSLTDQMNLMSRWLEIVNVLREENRDPTIEEQAEIDEAKNAKIWIAEQRALCQAEIEQLYSN